METHGLVRGYAGSRDGTPTARGRRHDGAGSRRRLRALARTASQGSTMGHQVRRSANGTEVQVSLLLGAGSRQRGSVTGCRWRRSLRPTPRVYIARPRTPTGARAAVIASPKIARGGSVRDAFSEAVATKPETAGEPKGDRAVGRLQPASDEPSRHSLAAKRARARRGELSRQPQAKGAVEDAAPLAVLMPGESKRSTGLARLAPRSVSVGSDRRRGGSVEGVDGPRGPGCVPGCECAVEMARVLAHAFGLCDCRAWRWCVLLCARQDFLIWETVWSWGGSDAGNVSSCRVRRVAERAVGLDAMQCARTPRRDRVEVSRGGGGGFGEVRAQLNC